VGSELGVPDDKLLAIDAYEDSDLFSPLEKLTLRYADAITLSDRDVDDELFAGMTERYSEEALVELTAVIAWENASSKFNRALRIGSQGLWRPGTG
jgi:alkylhydroperoxidase family enzyme